MTPTKEAAQELKDLLGDLLPFDDTYTPAIGPDIQAKKLDTLEGNINNESFYFVFNLLTCQLEHVRGVEKWLGYPDREFTLPRYLGAIHNGQAILHNMMANSMYKTLCSGVFRLHFDSQKYISFVGLRHYNGQYILFKKITSIFQYDTKNRLLAQLNEFSKIDIYENAPLNPRITEMEGLQKDDFQRRIFSMTVKTFMNSKYFSRTEFEVLKHYASPNPPNSRQLATLFKVKDTTIDTYNKRILTKARNTFTRPFANAREVALYLNKEKIL